MRIDYIDSGEDIALLVPDWLALWHRCMATPFQSPQWLLAWCRHFADGMLQIVTARDDGVLVGVLPLYVLREPDRVKLLPLGIGLSDYLDALVAPDRDDVARALLGVVADLPDWQECHLPDLPPGAALLSPPCPSGCEEERAAIVPCPVLTLPGSADGLSTVVPQKTLRDLRQAQHRSKPLGSPTADGADRDTLGVYFDDLFRLHEKRWRSRSESGVCADPAVQRFHREAARAMHDAGLLRLYRLRIGDAVAAVYYGFAHRDRAYAYLGGFDPDLPRLSPGAQIIAYAIGAAIGEGATEFHFLRGGEAYKYAWGAVDRWNTARTFRR
jgi:CelD/BcsL family acetyltransferase involved in cellulose biosynthesis